MNSITLASFNIGACSKMFGRYDEKDLYAVAGVIKKAGADVIALQEVDRGCSRSLGVDMAALIGRAAGYRYRHFIAIRPFQGGTYGTAILSRYPIIKRKTINYNVKVAKQGTSCGYAVINVNGSPLTVFNTHLSCESEEANLDTMSCLDGILSAYPGAFCCCGDFNTSPSVIAAHVSGVTLANRDLHTYADVCIDNVLCRGVSARSVRTVDATTELISDHNMLMCEIDFE